MRKQEVASLVVYLLMIVLAVVVGLTAIKTGMQTCAPQHMNQFAFVIVVILVGLLFNIVMLELLHALGGIAGGYKVVSINILGFCFEKREGKWVFKFKDFDGLTGETKLVPNKEKRNLKLSIWFPLFGYAAELAGGIVAYTSMLNAPASVSYRWIGVAGMLFVVISSMIALYNLIPIKLDSTTDGYKLVLLTNPTNLEAMDEFMKTEDLQRQGKEVNSLKVFEEITEFTANINLISVFNHLVNHKYSEAEEIIDLLLKDPKKLEPNAYNRIIAQKLYVDVMSKSIDEAKKVYQEIADDKVRRFIANDIAMESIRAYVLISGVIEGSQGELKYAISRKEKGMKRALASVVVVEEKLFQDALNKVYEVHPDWQEENAAK